MLEAKTRALYHPLLLSGGRSVVSGAHMKVLSGTIALVLIILVSVPLVTGCAGLTAQKPAGMTLEDAPTVLDLSAVLPSCFVALDEWQTLAQGLTRENLGLGIDASELFAFRSENPFQLVYCFVRIIEDVTEQSAAARNLFNETIIRNMATDFLDFVASEQGFRLPEPAVAVNYPSVGVGAALAAGEIKFDDDTLRFDMLSFRSEDKRVFGFVHSWHISEEQESVIRLGREIEKRIMSFGR